MRWSVLIPAFNPGPTLTIALDSVLVAVGDRTDVQIVVVDDCSDPAIDLAGYDDRIEVVRNPRNVGAVPNFNRALGHAKGDFVHLLHADDYVRPDFYRRLEVAFDDLGIGAAACGIERVDAAGHLIEIMKPEQLEAGIWPKAFDRLAVSNRLPAAGVVVRRSIYNHVGSFDESLHHAADWDMWIRVAEHASFYYEPEVLAAYRIHPGQHTSGVVASGANIAEAVAVIDRLDERVADARLRARLKSRAFAYRAVYAVRTSLDAIRARRFAVAAAQLRQATQCAARAVGALRPRP